MTNPTPEQLEISKKELKELSDNCQNSIQGFLAEVCRGMPEVEAKLEISIQQRYKDAINTALRCIEIVKGLPTRDEIFKLLPKVWNVKGKTVNLPKCIAEHTATAIMERIGR